MTRPAGPKRARPSKPRHLTHRIGSPDRKTAAKIAAAQHRAYLDEHRDTVTADHTAAQAKRNADAMHRVHLGAVLTMTREADVLAAELLDVEAFDEVHEMNGWLHTIRSAHYDAFGKLPWFPTRTELAA